MPHPGLPDDLPDVDMPTRTSEKNDVAPAASVFPAARNPETGGRKLEWSRATDACSGVEALLDSDD